MKDKARRLDPKPKALFFACTVAVVVILLLAVAWATYADRRHRRVGLAVSASRVRAESAIARFADRCKGAGEVISEVHPGEDSIAWLRWRPQFSRGSLADQWSLSDPLEHCDAEGCIYQILRPTDGGALFPETAEEYREGFSYVETVDPRDGHAYRYRGVLRPVKGEDSERKAQVRRTGIGVNPDGSYMALEREPISSISARFGIRWEDVSTPDDRSLWIAGRTISVVDLRDQKVLGSHTTYMMDVGGGGTAGERLPWAFAFDHQCPGIPRLRHISGRYMDLAFIRQVLPQQQ